MLPYAMLKPGPGFRPSRAAAYYLQRSVTAPAARRLAASALAAVVRTRQGGPPWALGEAGARALAALRSDGVAPLAPLLPRADIDRMVDYFSARPLVAPDGRLVARADLLPGAAAAGYPLDVVLACPGLVGLINRPDILALAGAYLGCKPTISSVGVRWTFPSESGMARFQTFHRDLDDWRFVKVFIYLTDVDARSGPHIYVRGSHEAPFGARAEAYDEAELRARYGADAIAPIMGPRGTSFIADTAGVHRGGTPEDRPRLILQIQYSLLPVYAFLYEPRDRSEADFDPYCSRLLLRPQREGGDLAAAAGHA